jgi:hypothetical protein
MTTMHLHQTTTATPEQLLAELTDHDNHPLLFLQFLCPAGVMSR